MGNTKLNLDTIKKYQQELKTCSGTNILLYGCNVAAKDAGSEFISKLHDITSTEIAASTTPIGNSNKGGNWELNYSTSSVVKKNSLAFTLETQRNYVGVLNEEGLESLSTEKELLAKEQELVTQEKELLTKEQELVPQTSVTQQQELLTKEQTLLTKEQELGHWFRRMG